MSEIDKKLEMEKDKESNVSTSNIFDEFEVDEETRKEIEEISINKDAIYYMQKISSVFKYVNYLLLFVILIAWSYVYIQKSESKMLDDKYYLVAICDILNWEWVSIGSNCSSLAISNKKIDDTISLLNKDYLKKLIPVVIKSYEIESIKNSKESIFIIDKSKNKNNPIFILNEFDRIKNEFTWILKEKIRCEEVKINWNILEVKCSAFTTSWDPSIFWFKWEKTINTISWTSITLAASFINYVSRQDNINILDKQKTFETSPYFGEWKFIYQTDFELKFEYSNNTLSL